MLGESENQFSLTRAALSTRGAKKQIPISSSSQITKEVSYGEHGTFDNSKARNKGMGSVALAQRHVDTVTFSHFTSEQAKDLEQRDERFAVRQVL